MPQYIDYFCSEADNLIYSEESFESQAQYTASQERQLSPAPHSTLPSPPLSGRRSISRLSSGSSTSLLVLGSPGRAVPVKPSEPPTPTHKMKTKHHESVVKVAPDADYDYGTPV